MRQIVLGAALALLNIGCGSAVIRAAESGDLKAFRAELKERLKDGDVSVSEAQDIARALIQTEILTSQGPVGATNVDELQICAEEFDGALRSRSSKDDEVGAHAALVLQEAGLISPMAYSHMVISKSDAWRAVAARSLTEATPAPGDGSGDHDEMQRASDWRRKLMVDYAAVVRLSAMRAAIEAADRDDVDDVLEAARLDPDPEVRHAAIQAAGAIGTREAVLGLKDVWVATDHEGKIAIVHAWAASWRKPWKLGDEIDCTSPGEHPSCEAWNQLQNASDEGTTMHALLASLELIHDVMPDKAKTPEGSAAGVVERLIDKGAPRIRVEAIASAPIRWGHILEAVVDASKAQEDQVAAAALGRMLELEGKERNRAIKRLHKIAKGGRGLGAAEAKRALVKARDLTVVKYLEKDTKAASRAQRIEAAELLAQLVQVNQVLALLGDEDGQVRSRTACAILTMDD